MSEAADRTTMPRGEALKQQLRAYIVDDLLIEPYRGDDPLADGVVDSLEVEQLIEYIQEIFRVKLDPEEITLENFESLPALVSLLESK